MPANHLTGIGRELFPRLYEKLAALDEKIDGTRLGTTEKFTANSSFVASGKLSG